MASRDHLRRKTSTPPPGGYGGDGSDDNLSRTSEVTGDQGRAARDESDASVSPRAWELYCTEEWVGNMPRAMYPGGDLGIYDDEQRCRYVIISVTPTTTSQAPPSGSSPNSSRPTTSTPRSATTPFCPESCYSSTFG